ncbi:SRPBCC family protein [Aestuariivirga sp.]|uniref:SRPBCC family protein n=1 Tax=Aestuariivirga sp. TaxID=2650926 RepID=UPI0039E60C38
MKRLVKWIVGIALALLVIVAGGAYVLPGEAHVERFTVISATPAQIFAVASSLKRFNEWSPWAGIDPATTYTYGGPDSGAGQTMSWVSKNPNVGSGTQTITDVQDNERVVSTIDFGSRGKAVTTLSLAPVLGGTGVTWRFDAPLNGIFDRWAGLMFDSALGGDFETGLRNLKAVVEKANPPAQ